MNSMHCGWRRVSPFLNLVTATLLVLLPACASHPRQADIPPVGPAPQAIAKPGTQGYLIVYSAWSNFVDQGSIGHHSRYKLVSGDGTTSREIINYVDRFDEGPIRLSLSPGAYRVRCRSAHFGRVNVPVIIQPHQTTFVYLDGASHPDAPAAHRHDAVRLPNGEIVGWSATIANNSVR
jgi:hypothetical protein